MPRPLYSFELVQSGQHVVVDACVPLGVGHKIFQMIAAAATVDRAPIATKRPPNVLSRDPELVLRSVASTKPRSRITKTKRRTATA